MSQLVETFRCGDGEALVTFVYGESSPAERDAIASHISRCAACAEEVAALGMTREQLAAWIPPEQTLGFRLSSDAAISSLLPPPSPATVLRPVVWWHQPLPAWAQMAAAVVIFASGMAIGGTWSPRSSSPAPVASPSSAPAMTMNTSASAPRVSPASGVTRQELAEFEQRLRGEIAQLRTAAAPNVPATGDAPAMMQRVSQMIAASEARQLKELDFRTSVMTRDWTNRRALDLANIEQRLGSTTVRVLSNQQDINSLAQRVGYAPGPSPYVP
jgi:anti-sigma factor RsiW